MLAAGGFPPPVFKAGRGGGRPQGRPHFPTTELNRPHPSPQDRFNRPQPCPPRQLTILCSRKGKPGLARPRTTAAVVNHFSLLILFNFAPNFDLIPTHLWFTRPLETPPGGIGRKACRIWKTCRVRSKPRAVIL